MLRIRRWAAAAALLVLSAPPAFGCQLSLSGPVTQQPLNYNPFQAGAATADVSFLVQNTDNKPCDAAFAFFRLGAPQAVAQGGALLTYQLLGGSGPATQNMAAAPSALQSGGAVATFTVGARQTYTAHATISVADGQVVAPGAYTDQLVLGLYGSLQGGVYAKDAEAPLTVAITVPSLTTLAVAGGGRRTTVNFEDFVEGAVRSVNLLAWSNQGFNVLVSSDNAGVMKPTDPVARAEGQWRVPYKIAVNKGAPVDLSEQRTISIGQAATAKSGLAIPIDVQVGSTRDQRAGIYRDVITVAIDPRP